MRLLLFAALMTLGLSCRTHTLDEGVYQLTLTEVLRDDCGLAASPALMTRGELTTTGSIVRLAYGYLDIELAGSYRVSAEQMILDGNVLNVSTEVRGQTCELDSAALHVETTTTSPTTFDGTLSLTLDSRAAEVCVCKVWVRFSAAREP